MFQLNPAGVLSLLCLFPQAVFAGDPDSGEATLGANAPAEVKMREEPSSVLSDRENRRITRRRGTTSRQIMADNRADERPWYSSSFVALSGILLLIGVAAWAFKRYTPSSQFGGGSAIKVLGKTHLSAKQSLALIRVGRKMMVVGVSPEHITHLTTIEDPTEIDLMTARSGPADEAGQRFDSLLGSEADMFQMGDEADTQVLSRDDRAIERTRKSLRDLLGRVRKLRTATGTV